MQLEMFDIPATVPPAAPPPEPVAYRPPPPAAPDGRTFVEALLARNVYLKNDPGMIVFRKVLDSAVATYAPVLLELQPEWYIESELVCGPGGVKMDIPSAVHHRLVRVMR